MKDWHTVHDSRETRPPTLEDAISSSTVYERKNIRQETVHDDMTETDYTEWVYEQREYTIDEYHMMLSPAIQGVQQSLSALELALAEL